MSNIDYKISTLDSGDKVVTVPIEKFKTKKVKVVYEIGSCFENESNHGIAHFIEHMLFNDSKNYSGERRNKIFDQYGGGSSAYTSFDEVVFSILSLEENFEKCIVPFFDMFSNPIFSVNDIEKEKNIIKQEIMQRYNNDSIRNFFNSISNMFPNSPISYGDITGTVESIMNFDRDKIFDFYKTYYVSQNRWFLFSGKTSHEEAVEYVKNNHVDGKKSELPDFNKFSSNENTLVLEKKDNSLSAECLLSIRLDIEWESFEEKIIIEKLIREYLSGGLSSVLYKKLREENNLIYGCGSYLSDVANVNMFSIYWNTTHENIEKTFEIVREELEKLKNIDLNNDNITSAINAGKLDYANTSINFKDVELCVLVPLLLGYETTNIEKIYNMFDSLDFDSSKRLFEKFCSSMKNNVFSVVTNDILDMNIMHKNYDKIIIQKFKPI